MKNFFDRIGHKAKRDRKIVGIVCLFLILVLIYNLNFRTIGSADSVPASLMPFSILENHNIYSDNFCKYYNENGYYTYFYYSSRGHNISSYPIVTPVLITPLYTLPYLLLKIFNSPVQLSNPVFYPLAEVMEKLSASIIAALSGVFVFLSIKSLINRRVALICTLAYALGTNTWMIGSQGLWQHGMVELLLSMMIYIVIRNEQKPDMKNLLLLGALSGLFIFNRPSDMILILPVAAFILLYYLKESYVYIASLIAVGAPFAIYNYYFFGSFLGAYGSVMTFRFDFSAINGFLGLMISPSRGILAYSPVIALAVIGFLMVKNLKDTRIKNFLYMSGIACILEIMVYSSFIAWWGGASFGPRFLTGMLPLLIIFVAFVLPRETRIKDMGTKEKTIIAIFIMLTIVSICVQIIGAFYYPNGNWDSNPSIDATPDRLWDLSDTQLSRSFNAGPCEPVIIKKFEYILAHL